MYVLISQIETCISVVIYTFIQIHPIKSHQALFWAYFSLCRSCASFSQVLIHVSVIVEKASASTVRVEAVLRYKRRQKRLRVRPSKWERGSGMFLSAGCAISIKSRWVRVLRREGSGKRSAMRLNTLPRISRRNSNLRLDLVTHFWEDKTDDKKWVAMKRRVNDL